MDGGTPLRGFNQILDRSSAKALLDIATDSGGDDDIRIEAVKILGLYHGEYDDAFIKEALVQIINHDAIEDDSLIVNCINTLALLTVNEKEIAFALSIIQGDAYILFKHAAFALICQNKQHPAALEALEVLLKDSDFGRHAKRELT
ncbi:hypothetical protein EQG67_20400 [Kosakonia cowanii]|jgi:hypothetical protein|uniref:hypothetical protein n=1 Tax=Kosakonia cowanii TaxID=208223 RepID=UPI000FECC6F0|nr:hypothetical protein [Kosakonia cowanii]QAR47956.1 hypothetical protein EQG67_20400 [Kosakonia cowanii]